MNIKKLTIVLCVILCAAIIVTAQRTKNDGVPQNPKFAPDLRVKNVTAEWVKKGRDYYLKVTPIIQKNEDDEITTEAGKPMIIFVAVLDHTATFETNCELEVTEWKGKEAEKTFGSCLLKEEVYPFLNLTVVVDYSRVIKESKEDNNVNTFKLPPKSAK